MGSERAEREQKKASSPAVEEPAPAPEAQAAAAVAAGPLPVPGLAGRVQPKLQVGAAADPAEAEADRVAGAVVQRLQDWHAADGAGESLSLGGASTAARSTTSPGAAAVVGPDGGDLDPDSERAIGAPSGGVPLPAGIRRAMEDSIGADFGSVRLHAGPQAAELNDRMAASAFTVGSHVWFRDGLPDTSTSGGQALLAHELTHTVQQGAAPVRRHERGREPAVAGDGPVRFKGAVGTDRVSRTGPVIQRHSAFEHYLLGQMQPSELKKIPEVRQVSEKQAEYANKEDPANQGVPKGLDVQDPTGGNSGNGAQDAKKRKEYEKTKGDVKHLIEQEMKRLQTYIDQPEALNAQKDKMGKVEKNAEDATWKVPIVVITCSDGELVVSYSEMNTMPDLFGNPEAMSKTPKAKLLALLQGIRQQLYIELDNLQKELFGKSTNKLDRPVGWDKDFEGATGPRGQAVNDWVYEKRTEKQVNKATTRKGDETEQYFAALERNACHFAPQSWSQWQGYHVKAREYAKEAADLRALAQDYRDLQLGLEDEADKLEKQADKKANDALIQNSFGEHYLQDSFAAGHLIDKTKIMQWFALWLDKNGGLGSTEKGKAQWSMITHAATQNLTSNPQALHDKGVRGEFDSAQEAAGEIGMGKDPSTEFMMKWRDAAAADPQMKHLNGKKAKEAFGIDAMAAFSAMSKLKQEGFAKQIPTPKGEEGVWFSLHEVHLKPVKGEMFSPYQATRAKEGTKAEKQGGKRDYAEEAAEFDLASYNLLVSNAYLGASTKYFHDKFCKEGLEVVAGTGDDIGRIYGDANMLNAGGQKGVEFSAETSRMSRESIFNMLDGKLAPYSVGEIRQRFPTHVKVSGKAVPLVDWNNNLHKEGDAGLFKDARDWGAKVLEKTGAINWDTGGISDKGALDVDMLTKQKPKMEALIAELLASLDDKASF